MSHSQLKKAAYFAQILAASDLDATAMHGDVRHLLKIFNECRMAGLGDDQTAEAIRDFLSSPPQAYRLN